MMPFCFVNVEWCWVRVRTMDVFLLQSVIQVHMA